jgi:NADPH-dependent 2,4-dienoyl-CoA reductase/sulfur reductase-like enzyme
MTGRIVIIGGGFAGVNAAMQFDKTLAHRSDIEVVLICRENFILFTPMLHEVAAGDLHPGDIITPLRRILRRVNVVEGEVQSIDLSARRVSCVAGVRSVRREFEFDHLLVALGSETNFFNLTLIWTAGVKPNAVIATLPFEKAIAPSATLDWPTAGIAPHKIAVIAIFAIRKCDRSFRAPANNCDGVFISVIPISNRFTSAPETRRCQARQGKGIEPMSRLLVSGALLMRSGT